MYIKSVRLILRRCVDRGLSAVLDIMSWLNKPLRQRNDDPECEQDWTWANVHSQPRLSS